MKVSKKNLILFAITILLFISFLEIFLAKFYPQPTLKKILKEKFNCYQRSDYLPFVLKPNCQVSQKTSEFEDASKINRLGYRDNEFSPEKPKNTFRALILGDSFTYGYGVHQEKTYPKLLENLLNKNHQEKKFEIINAGFASGFSPDSYYLYLKKEGLALTPNLIIFTFFVFNDFTDLKDHTFWEMVDENNLPEKITDQNRIVNSQGYLLDKKTPWYYKSSLLSNSHLFIFLGKTIDDGFTQVKLKLNSQKQISTKTATDYYLCLFANQCFPQMEEIFSKAFRVISASQRLAEKNQVQFLFLIIPTDVQLYDDVIPKYQSGISYKSDPPYPQTRINKFLQEEKIKYLDLLPFFEREKERLFYKEDGHFNEKGHEITANLLYEQLTKLNFF